MRKLTIFPSIISWIREVILGCSDWVDELWMDWRVARFGLHVKMEKRLV
jgi:hypothetical protein